MTGAGIVSEAFADGGEPLPWLPPPLAPGTTRADDADFGPFLIAAARALSRLFGAEVQVLPGRATAPGGPRIAEPLAALLMTLRMGGDPARAGAIAPGSAGQRYAAAIAATLDDVAQRVWPPDDHGGFDLDIACGDVAGHAHVPAPPPLPANPAAPRARIFVADLPLRLRVELASAETLLTALLPLRAGLVVPIDPNPEMPLLIGEHRIGRATVASLADGRQQATIVAIAVTPAGGRT